MLRSLTPSSWELVKWCGYALVLLAPGSLLVLLLLWFAAPSARRSMEEQYLDDAVDLADLERRMRVLERASGGPAFVTFNH